ncbi:MAG TPA: PqqD family protein [Bacteriovoracaceae bacterium]|nr:PqqD family protein [Bacteriovoracaceae bacterium]
MDNTNQLFSNLKISEEIVVRENKDGTVIAMKMDDGDIFYKIDGVAAEIFKDIRKNVDLKTAIEKASQSYKVDAATILADATPFLNKLIELGLASNQ